MRFLMGSKVSNLMPLTARTNGGGIVLHVLPDVARDPPLVGSRGLTSGALCPKNPSIVVHAAPPPVGPRMHLRRHQRRKGPPKEAAALAASAPPANRREPHGPETLRHQGNPRPLNSVYSHSETSPFRASRCYSEGKSRRTWGGTTLIEAKSSHASIVSNFANRDVTSPTPLESVVSNGYWSVHESLRCSTRDRHCNTS